MQVAVLFQLADSDTLATVRSRYQLNMYHSYLHLPPATDTYPLQVPLHTARPFNHMRRGLEPP